METQFAGGCYGSALMLSFINTVLLHVISKRVPLASQFVCKFQLNYMWGFYGSFEFGYLRG